MAGVHARWDFGAREGQHAVRGQGAGECGLVHVGRQAVAAVELAGDVAMVILGMGRARSEALQQPAAPGPRGGGPGCTRSNPRCSPGRWVVGAGPCPEPWTSLPPCMRSGSAQGPLAPLTNFIPTSHEWSCPGSALKSNFPFTWPQDHLGSGPCRPSNWKATPGHSHLLVPWPSSPTLQV